MKRYQVSDIKQTSERYQFNRVIRVLVADVEKLVVGRKLNDLGIVAHKLVEPSDSLSSTDENESDDPNNWYFMLL